MKTQKVGRWLNIAACLITSITLNAAHEMPVDTTSLFQEWQKQDALKFDLEFDINLMLSQRNSENTVPAILKFKKGKKEEITWNAEIRTGGRYRLKVCDFPPLRIRLSKEELRARGFSGHNSFKLVTHCKEDRTETDVTLAKEGLVYQIYQQLSEYCLQVKMVRITYRDIITGKKMTRTGVLIEDDDEMADRLGGELCKDCYGTSPSQIEPKNQLTQALFQYMIGNTDWSLEMNRNVEIMTLRQKGVMVAVPFDFDFSGFVNAPYAVPDANLGLKSIRERAFKGQAVDKDTAKAVCDLFISRKKVIRQLIEKAPGLNWDQRQDLLAYISDFYAQLEGGSLMGVISRL